MTEDLPIPKPDYPEGVKDWWRKPIAELDPQQQEIRRTYYKQYHLWKKYIKNHPDAAEQAKPAKPKPRTNKKLPQGSGKWWNKPVAELTEEQREMKRAYAREHKKKYYKNNPDQAGKQRERNKLYQRRLCTKYEEQNAEVEKLKEELEKIKKKTPTISL